MRILRLLFVFSMKCFVFSLVMNPYLITLSTAAATSFDGNKTDHLALLAFKAKITYDPQSAFRSWNDSIHFCNWEGVTCGRKHRRVTILDFQSIGLVGSLSPSIGNMSFLRELRLQNNSLHGEISPELGRLFRLQFLHLGNNSFTGQIPTNLSRCSNLQILRVSYNKLEGNIPMELGSLSKLRIFSMQNNYLSGNIPPSIGNLTSLEALSARENFLSGTIPESLGQLKNLLMLAVATNKLSGIIPPAIYNISSINIISVSENQLHGCLPSNLGFMLPHLQHFQIWGNQFSGSIPVSLSNASELEYIDLQRNNFTGKVAVHFGALRRLYFLSLYGNSLGSEGGDDLSFITSLLNCSNLAMLDISRNQLEGALPNSLANLSSLQRLSIGKNRIYGGIPPWFSTLDNLLVMGIEDTQLTGTIPMEFGKLQNLQQMFLGHNRLSGEIPSSLGNLSSLTLLHLQANKLQGTIPSSLGNCQNLLFIDLSQNNLNGSIPSQLFSVPMLVSIDFSQNHLVGSLPSQIGYLTHLNELVIFQNNLSGCIPFNLGKCSSLEYLVMGDNKFQCTIPTSFESLRGLRRLDLSMNNLSGKMPDYFVNFKLEYLNLSFNNLEGEVPSKGVFANASVISIEGNNRLCGGTSELKLPRCMSHVSKRSKLHLVEIVVIIISCVFMVAIMSACLCCWLRHEKKEESPCPSIDNSLQQFSYGRIFKATNGFSSENLIGAGNFGSVYKGHLDEDEAIVAIKVLNLQQPGASKSFMAECETLKNIRHRNLLKIITSCSSIDFQGNEFKALIYEYMPNGNLEKWLHPTSNIDAMTIDDHCSLSLLQRIDILIDVGNALDYLHFHCQKPIIHCDLKPSNVLLDDDMVAHVGDFGLAKFLHQPPHSSSLVVRGTIGYTAPEYGLANEMSANGDIYSFGIILLEMMTRKKPTNVNFGEGDGLHNLCKMAFPDQVLEIVDPILLQGDEARENDKQGSIQTRIDNKSECLISMMKIGIACSMEAPQDRMGISDALKNLYLIRKNCTQTTMLN
ncbi:probable LRR receptor-like serine/threonine-protein kinase At3g47570 [Manihot esculenta]|uniref:Uncharacterized protein n=2 Tax=Manihot esculenta TaxID=3983 RepID=A0ACB7H0B7_MANES|nr:probable LRR receptor-like serine/threonine-protein kinase At3g47570 [Manihot esculenta]KAG8646142.1 hypothetical protein MANES_10G134900v8 [Manihot esculenta]